MRNIPEFFLFYCCSATYAAAETGMDAFLCKYVDWRQPDKAVKRQGCLSRHLALSRQNVPYPRVGTRLLISVVTPTFSFLTPKKHAQHTAHGTTEIRNDKIIKLYSRNKKHIISMTW